MLLLALSGFGQLFVGFFAGKWALPDIESIIEISG
jgi:hypothetical protein